MTRSTISREVKIVLVAVFLIELGLAAFIHVSAGPQAPGYEAVVRTGVGADLLAGESRGRQGFIGSLYWAPLPTLLMLPFLAWPLLVKTGFAASIIAAFAVAGACAFLVSWWSECGVRRGYSLGAVAFICASPWTVRAVARGDGSLLFGLLALSVVALTIRWLQKNSLRDLAYLSVLMGLLLLTRFQSILLVAAVLLLVLIYLIFWNPEAASQGKRSYAEATLIIFLSPIVYAFLVWLAANWLIMGNATFFLRGLIPSHWPPGASRSPLAWLEIFRSGCEWHVALIAALLAGVAWLMGPKAQAAEPQPSARSGGPGGAAVIVMSVLIFGVPLAVPSSPEPEEKETNEVLDYLVKHHFEDRVVVAGYRGYDLVRRVRNMPDAPESAREMFVHIQTFYFGKVLADTRGKRLYLLIHRPIGSDRWEEIQLRFPGISAPHGADFTVFEKGWKDWQLLEVVRRDQ